MGPTRPGFTPLCSSPVLVGEAELSGGNTGMAMLARQPLIQQQRLRGAHGRLGALSLWEAALRLCVGNGFLRRQRESPVVAQRQLLLLQAPTLLFLGELKQMH